MTIRTLSLIPLRSQPSTFSANMEDLLSNLPGWTSEVNALGEDVTAKQITASDAATTALTAIAGVNATKWVSGTTYALNASVWSPLNYQPYRRKVAGAGTTDPSSDTTNWAPLSVPSQPRMYYSARTSNTELGFDDFGKLIDITSGTFTQTFASCASLTNGWWCYLRNRGSGTITLEPYGSETVEGENTLVAPKGVCLVICNGASLALVPINTKKTVQILTSGTSWVCPTGVNSVRIKLVGAGGAGAANAAHSGGGGGGGCAICVECMVVPGVEYAYAIGAGVSASVGGSTTITINGVTHIAMGGGAGSVFAGGIGGGGISVGGYVVNGSPGCPASQYAGGLGGVSAFGGGMGAAGVPGSTSPAGESGRIILEY